MDTVKDVTVYPTPFVKPHCVLIVADATVLQAERKLGTSTHNLIWIMPT